MQSVIALGFFDGVHLGHGALLSRAAALAAERGITSVALTFDRSPGKDGRLLTSVTDRIRLIQDLYHVQAVTVLPFTEDFMRLSWDRFLESLVRDYGAVHLVCGWDYRFGHMGRGDPTLLARWCEAQGLGWDVVDRRTVDGVTVSSTLLKRLIQAGDTEAAIRYYGHPHTLSGVVQPGRHLGHTLGFPTANLLPEPELLLPRDGVYAVRAAVRKAENEPVPTMEQEAVAHTVRRYIGVCNVGTRPTVGGHRRTVETWLADFDGDLYGKVLTVEFYRFLREEQKFDSLEALREEIFRNRAQAAAYFREIFSSEPLPTYKGGTTNDQQSVFP